MEKRIHFILSFMIFTTSFLCLNHKKALGQTVPVDPNSEVQGIFGNTFSWPVIPIHLTLLPDGRVLSFGTDQQGNQGALIHSVWDPSLGTDSNSHMVFDPMVSTDIFCAGQSLVEPHGDAFIVGGDVTVDGVRNYPHHLTNFFNYQTNQLTAGPDMAFRRWYPTLIGLANGDMLALGGLEDKDQLLFASTPEVYTPGVGFRTLVQAQNEDAYGKNGVSWFYPRAFQAPNGRVFILSHLGKMYYLNTKGQGSLRPAAGGDAPPSEPGLPSVMYAPGKILSLRESQTAITIDLNRGKPVVLETNPISQKRIWSSATVLADGKVLVSGGSSKDNELVNVAYRVEIWDPKTGIWTQGAEAAKPRLYHSNALLLQDATVLTGGGGAPGPLTNLDAEIYYPPYLFKKDGSGALSERPTIVSAPSKLTWGKKFSVEMGNSNTMSRVTLVRAGSSTHSFNADQRFMELRFKQKGSNLQIVGPKFKRTTPPGFYMLFVMDAAGTPSVAKMIHLTNKR